MKNTEAGLIPALEKVLQAASTPLDANQLFALPEIRAHARGVSRVSDFLGNLWRKGCVDRLPGTRHADGLYRWLYQWRGDHAPATGSVVYKPRVLADRPSMLVTEEGQGLTVELPNLVISIRQKLAGFPYLEGLKNG